MKRLAKFLSSPLPEKIPTFGHLEIIKKNPKQGKRQIAGRMTVSVKSESLNDHTNSSEDTPVVGE